MIPQFIGAFFVSSALVVSGSLLWPVISKQSRPAVLQAVRDAVVETDAGKKAEEVLGVYADPQRVPQNISSVSSQVVTHIETVVQQKTEEIVTRRVIEEVVKRFETLPSADQEEIKAVICKTSE